MWDRLEVRMQPRSQETSSVGPVGACLQVARGEPGLADEPCFASGWIGVGSGLLSGGWGRLSLTLRVHPRGSRHPRTELDLQLR